MRGCARANRGLVAKARCAALAIGVSSRLRCIHMHASARDHESARGRDDDSMTDRSATRARARAVGAGSTKTETRSATDVALDYAPRGRACAFANIRLLGRVVTTFYDEALKPADIRASQLALLWAILACEPVEMGRLGDVTQTDQTTLSRTVDKLRQAGLVAIERAQDRRVRLLRLTAKGRQKFARAMPLWEEAQRNMGRSLLVDRLEELARQARRLARAANAGSSSGQ